MWGFKTCHERAVRLFAFALYFSLADFVVLQHFTNIVHVRHAASLLQENKPETRLPKSISNTWVSCAQNDAQFFSPQSSQVNLIDLRSAIQTPWLKNDTDTHSSNTGLFNPLNYSKNLLKYDVFGDSDKANFTKLCLKRLKAKWN